MNSAPHSPKGSPPHTASEPKRRSRKGCLTCRKRHKKCDEQRPACQNCKDKSFQCEYPAANNSINKKRDIPKIGAPPVVSQTPLVVLPKLSLILNMENGQAEMRSFAQTLTHILHIHPNAPPFLTRPTRLVASPLVAVAVQNLFHRTIRSFQIDSALSYRLIGLTSCEEGQLVLYALDSVLQGNFGVADELNYALQSSVYKVHNGGFGPLWADLVMVMVSCCMVSGCCTPEMLRNVPGLDPVWAPYTALMSYRLTGSVNSPVDHPVVDVLRNPSLYKEQSTIFLDDTQRFVYYTHIWLTGIKQPDIFWFR